MLAVSDTWWDSLSRDFDWFLYDLDERANEYLFVRTCREDIAGQVFLDMRWRPRSSEIIRLPIDAVVKARRPFDDTPPLNFIWHTAFCCSTLIAKLLDRPGRNLSLREPMAFTNLAEAVRSGGLRSDGPRRDIITETVFRLLARRDEPASQVTIKPSNSANLLIPEAAERARGKSLVLFSDLPSFIVSIVNGGAQYRDFVRLLVKTIARDRVKPLPWSAAELDAMPPLKTASLAWHLQIEQLRQNWPGDARAASLNCDAFLRDPAETLQKLDAFFGFGLGPEHIKAAVEGPILSHHAKSPEHPFTPQMRAHHDRAIRRQMGPVLDRLVDWSYREFPDVSGTAPLPNPLAPVSA